MKTITIFPILTLFAAASFGAGTAAQASVALSTPHSTPVPTWRELHRLVEHCAIEVLHSFADGQSLSEPLTSTCPQLRKINEQTVEFDLHHATYRAVITESPLSDGGDLQDLAIFALPSSVDSTPPSTPILEARTILSFGDPILALALGQTDGIRTKVGNH